MIAPTWLSFEEGAAYVGLARETARKMCARGDLPHRRVNYRLIRFRKDELDAWLDSLPGATAKEAIPR